MKHLRLILLLVIVFAVTVQPALMQDEPIVAEPGQNMDMLLLPKALGNAVFDQAHEGAMEAHEELQNGGELIFNAPADANAPGQVEIIEFGDHARRRRDHDLRQRLRSTGSFDPKGDGARDRRCDVELTGRSFR